MFLINEKTGKPVKLNDKITCFRGEVMTLLSAVPPQHEASTGRVYAGDPETGSRRGYFPSVFNLKFVEVLP